VCIGQAVSAIILMAVFLKLSVFMWFPLRTMQHLMILPGIYFYAWEPEK